MITASLDKQVLQPEKVTLVNQREVQKQLKFLGRVRMQPGQKLWELDLRTKYIREVVEFKTAAHLEGGVQKKFTIKENCLYAVALNLKNAERHFLKMFK